MAVHSQQKQPITHITLLMQFTFSRVDISIVEEYTNIYRRSILRYNHWWLHPTFYGSPISWIINHSQIVAFAALKNALECVHPPLFSNCVLIPAWKRPWFDTCLHYLKLLTFPGIFPLSKLSISSSSPLKFGLQFYRSDKQRERPRDCNVPHSRWVVWTDESY